MATFSDDQSTDDTEYNPADDDNQGVLQRIAQDEEAATGVSQADYMNPATAQTSGPIGQAAGADSPDGAVNDELLTEEAVEDGDITETDSDE